MKLKMSKEVDLGKEPIGHLLLILALPSITSQVVNALYNMVDRMYIGHIPEIGSAALPLLSLRPMQMLARGAPPMPSR